MYNKVSKMIECFDRLTAALNTHRARVTGILNKFGTDVSNAKVYSEKYVDAKNIFRDKVAELVPKARNEMLVAGTDLADAVDAAIKTMKDELQDRLMKPVSEAFKRQLSLYRESGLRPGKAEVESLITLADGVLLAQRVLHCELKKMDADYTFEPMSVEQLEDCIARLERFSGDARYNPMFPTAQAVEAMKVYAENGRQINASSGEKENNSPYASAKGGDTLSVDYVSKAARIMNDDGTESMVDWDTAMLAAQSGKYETFFSDVESMRETWEQPNKYPDVLSDPEGAMNRRMKEDSAKKATVQATVDAYTK